MNFVRSLVHSDDRTVDSIVVAGLFSLVVVLGLCVAQFVIDPHSFSAMSIGGGASTIIAAAAAAKTGRDRYAPPMMPMMPTQQLSPPPRQAVDNPDA